jgi:NitT/TauT family transport system permease protein
MPGCRPDAAGGGANFRRIVGAGLARLVVEKRTLLEAPDDFAGLPANLIGLLVENLIFRTVERRIVPCKGLQS